MDATQWAGLVAFGGAAAACLSLRGPSGRILAAVNGCLAAECALGFRHGLHDRVIALLGDYYPERQPLQIALVLIAAFTGLILLARRWRRARKTSASVPLIATGAALLLFAVETISLHALDRLLYRPAGPVLVIGWLWVAIGTMTLIGAARDYHRARLSS
ncbi:hypothetical protein AOA14_16390 [Sphingopyxis terrae subsp. terrae NBRC 15098]|uniref:Uncharacterized protein n=1 Tax=Sphingopyxis terrae subsp. terrae NBRC 15098 TaxID=1219058 RepID=A0A142W2C8_9SPHN|nr:hypothetical protein [Sphingopyxis terrae]AMU96184.1 hypothetical protein AOA14_16390 [Sphingopyxis terrae subsp. terrae NBRC 15098]